jgi:hypothetical protein
MNSWRDTWTQKNYKNIRELKEASKIEAQESLADIFEKYQNTMKEK